MADTYPRIPGGTLPDDFPPNDDEEADSAPREQLTGHRRPAGVLESHLIHHRLRLLDRVLGRRHDRQGEPETLAQEAEPGWAIDWTVEDPPPAVSPVRVSRRARRAREAARRRALRALREARERERRIPRLAQQKEERSRAAALEAQRRTDRDAARRARRVRGAALRDERRAIKDSLRRARLQARAYLRPRESPYAASEPASFVTVEIEEPAPDLDAVAVESPPVVVEEPAPDLDAVAVESPPVVVEEPEVTIAESPPVVVEEPALGPEPEEGEPESGIALPPAPSLRRRFPLAWELAAVVAHIAMLIAVIFPCFYAYEMWFTSADASHTQHALAAQLTRQIDRYDASHGSSASVLPNALPPPTRKAPEDGTPLAQISIPAIGASMVVVEGVTPADLSMGPGHYPGTARPGEAGNVAIAGHRVTYLHPFYYLDQLTPGDRVIIRTVTRTIEYRVTDVRTVSPTDTRILAPTGDDRLTLTTANPVMGASTRLVVIAELSTIDGNTPATVTAPMTTRSPLRVDPTDLAGTGGNLVPVILWGIVLLSLCAGVRLAARRYGARPAYLVTIPLVVVAGGFFIVAANGALPATI